MALQRKVFSWTYLKGVVTTCRREANVGTFKVVAHNRKGEEKQLIPNDQYLLR